MKYGIYIGNNNEDSSIGNTANAISQILESAHQFHAGEAATIKALDAFIHSTEIGDIEISNSTVNGDSGKKNYFGARDEATDDEDTGE